MVFGSESPNGGTTNHYFISMIDRWYVAFLSQDIALSFAFERVVPDIFGEADEYRQNQNGPSILPTYKVVYAHYFNALLEYPFK